MICCLFLIHYIFILLYRNVLRPSGGVFLSLVGLYYFLVIVGQTFYSFQWDTLLLETGFITALCYCDWWLPFGDDAMQSNFSHLGVWPLRFLLFKLMFMSGVVKLQANCPTWNNLTALEFHFATQCLPGPFAWYAHQLHPFLLRLSVAFTLLIEIPWALLVIVPLQNIRRFGSVFQIILQVIIILTGNYNFFNILTITLCLPCIEDDGFDVWGVLQFEVSYFISKVSLFTI